MGYHLAHACLEELYPNIILPEHFGDSLSESLFVAVLRAVVAPRLHGKKFVFCEIDNNKPDFFGDQNTLCFCHSTCRPDYDNWGCKYQELVKLNLLFSQHNAKNSAIRIGNAIIDFDPFNYRNLFYYSFTPFVWAPELFEKEPLTAQEKKFFAQLFELEKKDWGAFDFDAEFFDSYLPPDYQQRVNTYQFSLFIKAYEGKMLISKEKEIADLRRRADEALRQVQLWNLEIEEYQRDLMSYDVSHLQNVLDLIKVNPNIEITSIGTSVFRFVCHTKLDNFDTDFYNLAKKTERSYLYTFLKAHPDFGNLLDAIFDKRLLTINQQAEFSMNIRDLTVSAVSSDVFPKKALWNVHANNFNCFGGYDPMVRKAFLDGDLCGVIMLCQNLTGSLNLGDTTVAKITINSLFDYRDEPILTDLRNGELLTPNQAIELLNKEGANNEQTDKTD